MFKNKISIICLAIMAFTLFDYCVLSGTTAAYAYSVNNDQLPALLSKGTTGNALFDTRFAEIIKGIVSFVRVVVVITTCVALLVVMLGLEGFNKTLWNWILGAGLACNFAAFLLDPSFFGTLDLSDHKVQHDEIWFDPDLKGDVEGGEWNFLGQFMDAYVHNVIEKGAEAVLPICLKILLGLTVAQATWDIAFKLTSGDKIKYIMSITIKMGFIVFMLQHWLGDNGLMHALMSGFEQIGLTMGGADEIGANCKPDSIVGNGIEIFNAMWAQTSKAFSDSAYGLAFMSFLATVATVVLIFLTGIEMFMARIEFYTMALLVMPLLPWMITSKFSFLSEKAIGLMFNLSIKVCAIAFMSTMAGPFLLSITKKFGEAKGVMPNLAIILQVLFAALVLYMLTKKISEIVSGLLSGNPALGGSMMTAQMQAVTNAAANGAKTAVQSGSVLAGVAQGASDLAKSQGQAGGFSVSTLANIGKYGMRTKMPGVSQAVQGYRGGLQGFQKEMANNNLSDARRSIYSAKSNNKEADKTMYETALKGDSAARAYMNTLNRSYTRDIVRKSRKEKE